jgi:hypothetical protein
MMMESADNPVGLSRDAYMQNWRFQDGGGLT